ncbi:c-type cytochrome [Marinicella meishanensis]|uniref:c-type cytochrome n=1 Tax=Marinicella meishanensis TaxID=2873263 RepID=UPI001CC0AFB5|nr:cytochrome c [Marinicella sp. NBU2979]
MKKLIILSLLTAPFWAQAGDAEKGKEKAQQVCATCHGMDGVGIDDTYPKLAGQYADYMEQALKDYRSGNRKNAIMAGFAATLTDEDIANLAKYYSTLKENRLTDLTIK